MLIPYLVPNPTLKERFVWHIQCLYNALGYEFRRLGVGHAMQTAISMRLNGLVRRLNGVFDRWYAGTLCAPRGRKDTPHPPAARAPPSPSRGEGKMQRGCAWGLLPLGFGWLRKALPRSGGEMIAFDAVLDDPEMKAIIATAPQVGRILRPFCHLLGIETPECLRLPKRQRKRWASPTLRVSEADEAKLARMTARFPDTPPARAAKRALRRMFAGLPVDLKKMSAVAVGYFLHPPRDDNCPPPEIGYGGRVFAPLPKGYVRPRG